MTTFEVLIDKENSQMALNRNLGVIDILPEKMIIIHENYIDEISYDEIEEIIQKKTYVEIVLHDGRVYSIVSPKALVASKGLQTNKNMNRIATIINSLLHKYWNKK
jgi:hypothetical protein